MVSGSRSPDSEPRGASGGLIRHRWLTAAGTTATVAAMAGGGLAAGPGQSADHEVRVHYKIRHLGGTVTGHLVIGWPSGSGWPGGWWRGPQQHRFGGWPAPGPGGWPGAGQGGWPGGR